MTEAIVLGVLWLLFAFGGAWAIYALMAFGGIGLAAATKSLLAGPVFVAVGAVGAFGWFAFAAIQTVLQIVVIVQLM